MIYDSLQAEQGIREVSLEDLIRIGCGYRHYLHLDGAERKRAERPQEILLRQHAEKVRLRISRYLRDCYGDEYSPGFYANHGSVLVRVDGLLGDRLVDIQVVSSSEYSGTRAPRRSILSAASKASLNNKKEALLIVINRDNQEWSFWNVRGDLKSCTEDIGHDIAYITRLVDGTAQPVGMASRSSCRVCPYSKTCSMEPAGDPESYSAQGVKTTPALTERTRVESHLWDLNNRPSGRIKKVIHPSSFSTSKCDRQIGYDLLGTEQHENIDPRLRRIFDTGHALHDIVQRALEMAVEGFEPEVRVIDEKLKISGHCDGRLSPTDGLEIKSIGSKGFANLQKAKPEHEIQATLYGAILGFERIHYVYVNKETGDIAAYTVPVSRKIWHKHAARAANINKTIDAGDMPPPIDKDYVCRRCSYAWICKPEMGTTATAQQKRTFT
jgi:CRISPR/Cas system-associated exonuclease Cas4 (RecB family)